MTQTPDIQTVVTSLVDYLDRHEPEQIARLRASSPQAGFLAPGKMLGPGDDEGGEADVYLDLAQSALAAAKSEIEVSSDLLRRRMRFAARVRFIGSMVAGLSAAGLIGALIAEARTLAFAGAGITFVSSVTTLIAQYVESPIYGENSGPQALFAALIPVRQQVTELLQEVSLAAVSQADAPASLALVREANKVVAQLGSIEFKIKR